MSASLAGAEAGTGINNIGFETGNMTNWTVQYWKNTNGIASLLATPAHNPVTFADLGLVTDTGSSHLANGALTGPATDPQSNNAIHYPLFGTYSGRINYTAATDASSRATSIAQTGTMTSADVDSADSKVHIRFAFAPVVMNPSHSADQQPYYFIEVKNLTKGTQLYSKFAYAGESGVPWIAGDTSQSWYYTNWQTVDLSPGSGFLDIGDQVSLTFVASACQPGRHDTYLYIDGGVTTSSFPTPSVSVTGPASARGGDRITYTYRYSNPGSAVTGVQVQATLPPNTTFVSTTGAGCTVPAFGAAGTVSCPIGAIGANASGSFDVVVDVAGGATFPLENGNYQISGTGFPTLIGQLLLTPETPIYTISGPSSGLTNVASSAFTITPSTAITGVITITPSGGGLTASNAITKTFSNSATPQTFTLTPTAVGTVTVTPSNNSSLIDPPVFVYSVAAGTYTVTGPSDGLANTASSNFTITPSSAYTGTITITPSGGGLTGSNAITKTFSNSSTPQTFTITPTASGTVTLTPSNSGNFRDPGALSYTVPSSYTFTGPSGGALNTASGAFQLTADAAYTGTITVTPSGGGLSTPVAISFSHATSATFTITPTAVGPVTLAVTSSPGLTNPASLTYVTPPAAPTIGTATPGNGQLSVAFTAPGSNGGSAITGYTVTCGSQTNTGSTSPIVVSGLTNGSAYTCTVTATNAAGVSAPSSASAAATPAAPGTSYTFTGPAGGSLNAASATFSVTPNGTWTGTITITPSGGGISTPVTLTFSNSAAAQTFTITPTAVGPVTLTPTNSGSLTNPSALEYATPPAAPAIGSATPGNGQLSVAFSAPSSTGGSAITGYTMTCGSQSNTGSGSPIVVSGLTNGTAYTCTVTATNAAGTSGPSSASTAATPQGTATAFTCTGPTGGVLNTPSTDFTVTPNGLYTGTITITPSGGGVSTPVTLSFSNSAVAQTFTITPTAVGPVTLTPANSGSLTNPSTLTYATPPGAPGIGAVTPGNGQLSVAFTAPGSNGGSTITGYTATCGSRTATGSGSPLAVTGLTNGTAYTCTVTATNAAGTSSPSSASTAATPAASTSTYTFTGPTGGALNLASSNFSVTPDAAWTGTITITPSGGGLSTPIALTFSNSAAAQTFTITPTAVGPVTLTPANSGSLSNPSALTYATPPGAPGIGAVTPGNGQLSVAFTAPGSSGGSTITGYTATCGSRTAAGSGSPLVVTGLTNGTAYTCTVTATNAAGTSSPSSASTAATPTAPAASYTLTGPSGGALNAASTNFSVAPDAVWTGTITITPSGGGLSAPIALTFSNSAAAQTFTITPTAVGPVTLTPANSGSLSNPSALTYATPPGAPAIGSVTPGNGHISVEFGVPASTGGSAITIYTATCGSRTATGSGSPLAVTGLTNGTAYTCTVTATNAAGISGPSSASTAATPTAPAASYTFTGPSGGLLNTASTNFTIKPDSLFTGAITITPSGGGLSAPILLTFVNSSAEQTFTITPTAVGPVSLAASNSGSLSNPAALTYSTPPAAPTIGAVTPGDGQTSVVFTAPSDSGGSPITGYAATCGSRTATGSGSPLVVTGLTNGTAYTCTVTAFNAFGSSAASAESAPVRAPALLVTMAHSGDLVRGGTANFQFRVSNTGGSPTSGAMTLVFPLASGLSYSGFTGSNWNCNASGLTVTCISQPAYSLAATAVAALSIRVAVAASMAASFQVTAAVSGGGDATGSTAADSGNVMDAPDLSIQLVHSVSSTTTQTTGTIRADVSNASLTQTSGGTTVTLQVPSGMNILKMQGAGWRFTVTGPGGTLQPLDHQENPARLNRISARNETAQADALAWNAAIEPPAAAAGPVIAASRDDVLAGHESFPPITVWFSAPVETPVVVVGGVQTPGDAVPANNTAVDSTAAPAPDAPSRITGADLALVVTHGNAVLLPQSSFVYSISAQNVGTAPSTGTVTVTARVASNATISNASGEGWSCNTAGHDVTCTRSNSLAPGAAYPAISIPAQVAAGPEESLVTTATVSGGSDGNPDNNTFEDSVQVGGSLPRLLLPDLSVQVQGSAILVSGQAGAVFTATVENLGGAAAAGPISVALFLPAALQGVSVQGAGWSCVAQAGSYTCTRPDLLGIGKTFPPIAVTGSLSTNAGSSVTVRATVTGPGAESNLDNNSAGFVSRIDAPNSGGAVEPVGQQCIYTSTSTQLGVVFEPGSVSETEVRVGVHKVRTREGVLQYGFMDITVEAPERIAAQLQRVVLTAAAGNGSLTLALDVVQSGFQRVSLPGSKLVRLRKQISLAGGYTYGYEFLTAFGSTGTINQVALTGTSFSQPTAALTELRVLPLLARLASAGVSTSTAVPPLLASVLVTAIPDRSGTVQRIDLDVQTSGVVDQLAPLTSLSIAASDATGQIARGTFDLTTRIITDPAGRTSLAAISLPMSDPNRALLTLLVAGTNGYELVLSDSAGKEARGALRKAIGSVLPVCRMTPQAMTPPIVNGSGEGVGTLTVHQIRDVQGDSLAETLSLDLNYRLGTGAAPTAFRIARAAVGQPAVTTVTLPVDAEISSADGKGNLSLNSRFGVLHGGVSLADIPANPAGYAALLSTLARPEGEVRVQLGCGTCGP